MFIVMETKLYRNLQHFLGRSGVV